MRIKIIQSHLSIKKNIDIHSLVNLTEENKSRLFAKQCENLSTICEEKN